MEDKITPVQKEAFTFYEQIKLAKHRIGEMYLEIGWLLREMKKKKLYKHLGDGGYDTWKQFLASPEIKIKYTTAEVYIKIYEYYIEELKLPKMEIAEIPLNQLNIMRTKLDKLPDYESKLEMIEKAKVLGYSDFKKEMIESGLKSPDKINISRCGTCGKLVIKYNPLEVCLCAGEPNIKTL